MNENQNGPHYSACPRRHATVCEKMLWKQGVRGHPIKLFRTWPWRQGRSDLKGDQFPVSALLCVDAAFYSTASRTL